MPITFREFGEHAQSFAIYPKEYALTYCSLGLLSEVGEVAGVIKRVFRGDHSEIPRDRLISEIGDVLWYVSEIARATDITLDDISIAEYVRTASITIPLKPVEEYVYQLHVLTLDLFDTHTKEIIDKILYTCICLCMKVNASLEDAAIENVAKLTKRRESNKIKGYGDDR